MARKVGEEEVGLARGEMTVLLPCVGELEEARAVQSPSRRHAGSHIM